MGCMNATGYVSGQLDSYLNNQKYNFLTYFFQQLTLLGFQESQFIVKKTFEISYIPHLKELQTNIIQDIYSNYDQNIYLEPVLTNQLRELYIKVCEFLIKYHDYPMCQLIDKVGHKYRCLLKQNSVFPKNLNLRNVYNQVQRFLFREDQYIIMVNHKDIGHELLQFLKTLKQIKFFLIFQVNHQQQQQHLIQIQQFSEINQLTHVCAVIGLEDKDDRFSVIYNLYQRVLKKSKKSNSDSHSKMLLDYMNSEDSDVLWEEGCLILNCPYDDSNELDEESKIITISNQVVKSIKPMFQRKLIQTYNDKAASYLKYQIDKSTFKQIKNTMTNEIVSALGLNSQSFKKYFSLKLTKITYYDKLKKTIQIRRPVKLKIFHNEIENKTLQLEQIINKVSNNNLNRISTNKFGTLSKKEIQEIIQIIFNTIDVCIQYTSLLHIQWSYGDSLLNSLLVQNKKQCHQPKYKWKIINCHTNFKIINTSLPQAQTKYDILRQFQKTLQNHQYSQFVQSLINSILEMEISIGDSYYPIQYVESLTFICQNTNDEVKYNSNQIDVFQETLLIILLDYTDISHIQLLDELILINKINQYRIAIINSNSVTLDFELLIEKKNLEQRTENMNIKFWLPSIHDEEFSEYLQNFYKLSLQSNAMIVNKSNQIIWKDHSNKLLETLNNLKTDPIIQKSEKSQSHYGLLKKMKKTLKLEIEKEIKQQGQFSLKNELSTTKSLVEFKWPKQVSYCYQNKSQKIINKQYNKVEYINESGIQMNMFENIVNFYKKEYY